MKKQVRLTLIIIIIAIGLIAFQLFRPEPTGPDLIKSAIRVLDGTQPDLGGYSWLSANELIARTITNESDYLHGKKWKGYLDLIDATRGTRRRLVGLTRAIENDPSTASHIAPYGLKLSSDGSWLLWNGCTAHMDGSGYHRWKNGSESTSFWIDGSTWVFIYWSDPTRDLVIHDAANPNADRSVPISSPEAKALIAMAGRQQNHVLDAKGQVISFTTSDDGLTYQINNRPADSPDETQGSRVDTITFPSGSRILAIPSPQMRSLLFIVNEQHIPEYADLFHRIRSTYEYTINPIERLCVYSLDRKEFYELGRVSVTSMNDEPLSNVSWLPGGKKVQFEYKYGLYTVDAE